MKYVNQLDYPDWFYVTCTDVEDPARREKGKSHTVATSGCGLCSAVMVAHRLLVEPRFELEDALALSYACNANHAAGTNYKRFAPAFAEKMGLELERTNDPERLRYCLRTGGAAVVHCGGNREGHEGVFSRGGHYITAISELPDGRIAILDPYYNVNWFDRTVRLGKVEIKHGVVAHCDMQVLVEDTANRDPGFYLFWRK